MGWWRILVAAGAFAGFSCSENSPSPTPPATPQPTANTAPSITSSATIAIDENALGLIYTLEASDADGVVTRRSLLSTGDASLFRFDETTGELFLDARLNFSAPSDTDTDNVYELTFEAEDNDSAVTQQSVSVAVGEAVLKARLAPSGNFELIDWRLELPVDDNGDPSGRSATIQENDLANGYEDAFFFTGDDGGLVMRSPTVGATTPNSSFVRTELREMLRRGDTSISARGAGDLPNGNNWALSSQPAGAQAAAAGIDGVLRVTLAVNSVTTTGANNQVGRFIIGQIHAKDDEPVRLYYRKLPANDRGVIYAEHELSGGADIRFDIVGDSSNNAPNPNDGFLLNERFTYEIIADGDDLTVNIYSEAGNLVGFTDIDMSASGYDVLDDFFYFKAGAYHVNNTATDGEFAQITIYELTNTHTGYPF